MKLKGALIVMPIIEIPNIIALNDTEEGSDKEFDIDDDVNDQLLTY